MSDRGLTVVTGATGHTGRRVVARLVDAGAEVRVLARDADKARQVLQLERHPDVQVHVGDVRNPESLAGLADGATHVVHTIGTRTYFGANDSAAVDVEGTRNLLRVLERPAPRLVFLSAFGVGRSSPFLSLFSAVLGNYFVHKTEAEQLVRESGLTYAIVRPVELRNRPPRSAPRINQDASLSLLRTVSRDVVAEVLAACTRLEVADRTFELCEGGELPLDQQLRSLQPDEDLAPISRTPLFG